MLFLPSLDSAICRPLFCTTCLLANSLNCPQESSLLQSMKYLRWDYFLLSWWSIYSITLLELDPVYSILLSCFSVHPNDTKMDDESPLTPTVQN